MSNNKILGFSSAKLLAAMGCKIEYRSKSPDAYWWPLLPQHLDVPGRLEYRLAPGESCWQNTLVEEIQKEFSEVCKNRKEVEHAKRVASSKANAFYERWKEETETSRAILSASLSPRYLLTPFTYEDRDQLRDKWITQPGLEYECKILSIGLEGIETINRLGGTIFISFHTLAKNWRFLDQTFCGKLTEFTASVDQDHTAVTVFKTTK